jgi:hypothetical protein
MADSFFENDQGSVKRVEPPPAEFSGIAAAGGALQPRSPYWPYFAATMSACTKSSIASLE